MAVIRISTGRGPIETNGPRVFNGPHLKKFAKLTAQFPKGAIQRDFGGCVHDEMLLHPQLVRLTNVIAYTKDKTGKTGWVDIPSHHVVVGNYRHDRFEVVLYNGEVKHGEIHVTHE